MNARQRGFTLVELMVTVAIVGLLASVAFPVAQLSMQRAKEQELRTALRDIRAGLDAYKLAWDEGRIPRSAGESGYPQSLDALVNGVEDVKSAKKSKIYFLRRIPKDPFAEGWGKRAYESPPDAPRAGVDVFDVYSLAPGIGLNGVPYREW
ncbi:MAG TPA: type II secretion system protein [Usitatibacter sp.]|nr:type II secretion system protein [Usitatibacter sp.]